MLRTKTVGAIGIALAFLLVSAATAGAKNFTVTGEWISQKGSFFRVPVHLFPFAGPKRHVQGNSQAATGNTGGPGVKLVLPAGFWDVTHTAVTAVNNNSVVQVQSNWHFTGPAGGGAATLDSQVFPNGTRPAGSFQWCPGTPTGGAATGAPANPSCPNNTPGVTKRPGRIQYTASANQFGGTMQYILNGPGTLVQLDVMTPTGSGSQQVIVHNPLAGTAGAPQVFGGIYGTNAVVNLGSGPATTGAVCGGGACGPVANGVITQPGAPAPVPTGPASLQTSFGMPFTDGTVRVSIPSSVNGVGPFPMTLVTKGSDTRNAGGFGNITLVAGGLSLRANGEVTPNTDIVNLKIEMAAPSDPNVPAMSPMGLAAGAALFVLAFGYAIRKRL